jgi:hypothetical protein
MAKSYQHLDLQERALIETQLGFGIGNHSATPIYFRSSRNAAA